MIVRRRDVARLLAGAIVCLSALVWLDSPLRPSATRRLQMLAVAPQSWGYFSGPRSEELEVFRSSNGGWTRIDVPLGSAANLFGLRRATVNHGAEIRTLQEEAGTRWSTAALTRDQLPEEANASPILVRNLARHPHICGEVLLVSRPPIPWAWTKSSSRAALPTRFARLSVKC